MHASRHVVLRSGAKWLLVAGVFSYSAWSMALGLGDITVHSGLNQPFKADIALVDAAGLSASDLWPAWLRQMNSAGPGWNGCSSSMTSSSPRSCMAIVR